MNTKPTKPIRLFWGENYAERPKLVKAAIEKTLEKTRDNVNLYPGSVYEDVLNLISKTMDISTDCIMLGHGIEGLIHITTTTFLDKDKSGAMFQPSFWVYESNLKRYKSITYPCNLTENIDVEDVLKKVKGTDLFFIASPNTATGNYLLTHKQIECLVTNYQGIVAVDECYFGLGDQTVIDLTKKYKNLLVYRGMTKVMGLASPRLGFVVGDRELIKKLRYHFRDIELDPIGSFSLYLFLETFPYFQELSTNTKKFFADFLNFMQKQFPNDHFIRTYTTFEFMDISNYGIPAHKVLNYLTKSNYVMSESELSDDSSLHFPNLIGLTPPPKEYWHDFAEVLKAALAGKPQNQAS